MAVLAKIIAYNNPSSVTGGNDFSLNAFWGEDYKNVFYVEGDLGRSEFIDTIETEVDVTGATERTQNSSTERYIISVSVMSPLLQFLKTIDKHDVKIIQFLDSPNQPQHIIKNIDIDDTGDILTPINLVYIKFEDETVSNASPVVYTLDAEKLAFWDNDNDGVKDLNGYAEFRPIPLDYFQTWQLYYEADGITPAISGDVKIMVYAVNPASTPSNVIKSLLGIFRGNFGDSFSDSTKWQSTQQIWNYFNIADTVGHTNRVQFDKRAFAQDNGYLSSETEDRAVDLRFDIAIDSSQNSLLAEVSTTLNIVHSIRGGFNSFRVYDITTRSYGLTTLGWYDEKNTLNTVQDIRTTGASIVGPITVANIVSITPYSNNYILAIAPVAESFYNSGFTTKGGFIGSNFRASAGGYNFSINCMETAAIVSTSNVLNFTFGASPLIFDLKWKYERNTTGGGYAAAGDITGAGAAEILLDNVLVTTLPSIAPATPLATGTAIITLPDTGLHTMLLTLPTTTGEQIFNEFEVQVKPLF